eukprot:TRINITY_DN4727_c0_g1_i1.p1 TRINITY_DN4727_c0_g1~~TRINITY_DN4727_c0_g1_i1.p1  ORF type:complete len:265 (-),score=53.50 TRINITY_DN4727_c0_g1_i1:218-1012(-)
MAASSGNDYESQKLLEEYLCFHFAEPQQLFPYSNIPNGALEFSKRCAEIVVQHATATGASFDRALDLGCAVGRSSFEMARSFKNVVGIDFSASFIKACNTLKNDGSHDYNYRVEGDIFHKANAVIDGSVDRSRCEFQVGDACNLSEDLGTFDAILAANLLCRLPNPQACLHRLKTLTRPGGLVVFTTPCSWMEQFTPKSNWLGGYYRDGKEDEPVRTFDGIKEIMEANGFRLVAREDVPLLIREHVRKFQYTFAEMSAWTLSSN